MLFRKPKPVQVLRVPTCKPTEVFAVVKPAAIPMYTLRNLASRGTNLKSTPVDLHDSLMNRVCDATGYTTRASELLGVDMKDEEDAVAVVPKEKKGDEEDDVIRFDDLEKKKRTPRKDRLQDEYLLGDPNSEFYVPPPMFITDMDMSLEAYETLRSQKSRSNPALAAVEDLKQARAQTQHNTNHTLHTGLVLSTTDPEVFVTLTRAHAVGAVRRTYHVVCHVPRCVNGTDLKILQEVDTQNSSLQRAIEREEHEVQKELGVHGMRFVPKCIGRDPFIKGNPYVGDTLARGGSLEGHLQFATHIKPEGQFRRRLGSLFVSGGEVNNRTACEEEDCCCSGPNVVFDTSRASTDIGGRSNPAKFQHHEWKSRHFGDNEEDADLYRMYERARLVGVHGEDRIAMSRHYEDNNNPRWLPRGGMLRERPVPVKLDYTLLGYNKEQHIALFEVETCCNSSVAVRAAFAAVGMPVVNDPVYQVRYRKDFVNAMRDLGLLQHEKAQSDASADRGGGKGLVDVNLKVAAAGDVDKEALVVMENGGVPTPTPEQQLVSLSTIGCGIHCSRMTFPNPKSPANLHYLRVLGDMLRAGDHDGTTCDMSKLDTVKVAAGDVPQRFQEAMVPFSKRLKKNPQLPVFSDFDKAEQSVALLKSKPKNMNLYTADSTGHFRWEGNPVDFYEPTDGSKLHHFLQSPEAAAADPYAQLSASATALNKDTAQFDETKVIRKEKKLAGMERAQQGTPQLHRAGKGRDSAGRIRCRYCGGAHHVTKCPKLEGKR